MAVNLNPWEVVTEGIRRGYKLRELRQLLNPYLNRVVVPIDNQHVHLNNLNLQARELKVFKSATGLRTVGVLLDKLGQDDKGIHLVLSMIYLGLELELLSLGEEKEEVSEIPELVREVEGFDPHDQEMAEATAKPSFYHGRPVEGPFQATPVTSQAEKDLLETLNRLKEMDYFQVLGLERTATSAAATKAFVKAARSYHPDSVPADVSDNTRDLYSQIFTVYNDAQQKLSNDESRQQYLEALESGHEGEEVDISNIMEAETVFQKGEMLLKSRKYQQALDEFDKAIQLNPDEGEFYIYQGYAKFMTNPKSEAAFRNQCISMINKGLQMRDGRVSNGFLFLGRIHSTAGDKGQARTLFQKAVTLEPNNVEASRELRLLNMRTDKKGHRKKKR
jgi:curved DNA-binding protein CbpA